MPVLDVARPDFLADEDLVIFKDSVGRFFDEHAAPADTARWRENGVVDRDMWFKAANAGLLGLTVPEEYGGSGGDYRHELILMEQIGAKGVDGFGISLHNSIVAPYIVHYGTEAQKQRWLPGVCDGSLVTAIAMTEPGAGSDLQAIKTRGPSRRRRLHSHWPKDLHHQRPDRQPDLRRRQDRRVAGRARRVADFRRDRWRGRGSSAAATCTSSVSRRRTLPSSSSMTCAFQPTTFSAATRARAFSS